MLTTITFLLSFFMNLFIVVFAKKIDIFVIDHIHSGPQKFHENPTPRIGGLGIFIAFTLFLLYKNLWIYVIVLFPVFLSGFIEDLTKTLHPKIRLFLMSVSGILAYILLDAKITTVHLPAVDYILSVSVFSFLFTVFALVGISNAINIIDGFNGLASGVSIMTLSSIAFVANDVGDILIRDLALTLIFAILGFFVINWPFGKIFLGDGGAYFIGFMVGLLAVLLVMHHPEVSPWFALAILIYPVWEVIFSIYRRKYLRNSSPLQPDAVHFHTLVYRIFSKKLFPNMSNLYRNSATSVFIWILNLFPTLLAVIFYNNTLILALICIAFAISYNFIYKKLIYMKIGSL